MGIGAAGGQNGGLAAVGDDGFDLLEIAARAAGHEVIHPAVQAAEGNGLHAAQAQAGDFHIGIGGGLYLVGGVVHGELHGPVYVRAVDGNGGIVHVIVVGARRAGDQNALDHLDVVADFLRAGLGGLFPRKGRCAAGKGKGHGDYENKGKQTFHFWQNSSL